METEINVNKLWFDNNKIFIRMDNGRELWQSLLWYPTLQHASDEQRNHYRLSYSGIHWNDIDEDVSFESFFDGNPEPAK
jgi:hypothetical protein